MELSLSLVDLKSYVSRQLNHFFPDNNEVSFHVDSRAFDVALQRTENCFGHVRLSAYNKNGNPYLNHLYSDQYCVFLWFLSNTIWKMHEDETTSNKLFYLNKSLHGFSCMYDTELPDIFLILHTVGIVLGKAQYSDYLVAFQGSTVGAQKDRYPILGQGVSLLPNSSIIGNCKIGSFSSVGNGVLIYETDIQSQTVIYKDKRDQVIKSTRSDFSVAHRYFYL